MTNNTPTFPLALLLATLTLLLAPFASANADLSTLADKGAMIERLLNNSSTANQILNSSETEPAHQLNQAKLRLESAQRALQNRRPEQAEKQLDYAAAAFASAAGAIANSNDRGEAQQNRFNELSVGIESFRLYVKNAQLKSGQENPLDEAYLDQLLNLAGMVSSQGNFSAANEVLDEGYMLTITAVSALKGGDTIVYSLDFQSPADEYLYELERFQGMMKLFRMIHPDMKLPPNLKWTEDHLRASLNDLESAEKLANGEAYPEAIKQLETASKRLGQILRLMGLPVS